MMNFTIGMGVMAAGGLVALLGVLLLFNRNGLGKIIGGLIIAVIGLAGVGVGYTLDQQTEITYEVTEITAVSARDSDNNYRVTLKAENGTETWIYCTDNQLFKFPKGEEVTLQKKEIKLYRDQASETE